MTNKREANNEDPYLEYGNYIVRGLKEPFEDNDGALMNYGVYLQETDACESTSASLPQAMAMAIGFERALKETVRQVEEESTEGEPEGIAQEPQVVH